MSGSGISTDANLHGGRRAPILCALLAVAALLTACDGPEQRAAAHLERGRAFYAAENYSKARLEFRNVLQIDGRNVEARYALATVDEAQGNLQQAFVNYRSAADQQPDHLPSLIKVGQYYLLGDRQNKAMEIASAILALSPRNADGLALRGAVYLRRGDLPAARREIEDALATEPTNLAAISTLVGIERKEGRIEKALAILTNAIGQQPRESNLRFLQVQILIEKDDLPGAEQVYRDLIESAPDNLDYKTSLAKLLIRQNRTDDAEAYLREMVASAPQNLEAKLLLVDFLVNRRGNAQAKAALHEFITENPAELAYRFSLAALYMRGEEKDKAIETYREIIDLDRDGPKNLVARAALAQVFMSQGKKEVARALIAEVLSTDANSVEALFLRARDRLEEGDNRGAIVDLRTLLREQPELADGRALLAEAHLRNGEPVLAIEALRILLEFGPENLPVRVELARQLARRGESNTALVMLREALAQVPDDPAALRVQAEVYAERGDWPALVDAATAIIEQTPEKALGHHIRGQAFLAQERYAQASADFAAVLALEPDFLDSMVGLVRSYLGREESKEAESFLLARLADSPSNAALHNLLGELYRATGKHDLAQGAFRTAIRTSKDYTPAYLNLAGEALRAGDFAGAIGIYREGLAAVPENEDLSFALGGALFLNKDYKAATEIYEAMLARNPDLLVVANNLASLIADFQYLDFAMLARALELTKPFDDSKNPDYLDTLGWVHYRLDNMQQALSYLEHAVAKAPDSPQLQYHLGMTYLAVGETAKARRALDQAVVDGADYPGVQVARAALANM